MVEYHGQPSRPAEWLQAVAEDQAEQLDAELAPIVGLLSTALESGAILVAVTIPPPVRGYAMLLGPAQSVEGEDDPQLAAIGHVLKDQPIEAYRALMSALYVQASLAYAESDGTVPTIVFDGLTTAPDMAQAIAEYGVDYGVTLAPRTDSLSDLTAAALDTEDEVADPQESTAGDSPVDNGMDDLEDDDPGMVYEPGSTAEKLMALVEDDSDEAEPELFACEECGREFSTEGGMKRHVTRSHT
nr:MAG TPA: C2H2 type zinc-finger protein [Caudoviricetes sp.]